MQLNYQFELPVSTQPLDQLQVNKTMKPFIAIITELQHLQAQRETKNKYSHSHSKHIYNMYYI